MPTGDCCCHELSRMLFVHFCCISEAKESRGELCQSVKIAAQLIGIFQDRPGAVIFGLLVFILALRLERGIK